MEFLRYLLKQVYIQESQTMIKLVAGECNFKSVSTFWLFSANAVLQFGSIFLLGF